MPTNPSEISVMLALVAFTSASVMTLMAANFDTSVAINLETLAETTCCWAQANIPCPNLLLHKRSTTSPISSQSVAQLNKRSMSPLDTARDAMSPYTDHHSEGETCGLGCSLWGVWGLL